MKKNMLVRTGLILGMCFAVTANLTAQEKSPRKTSDLAAAPLSSSENHAHRAVAPETQLESGVSTLYARDPLSRTLCFRDGQGGSIIQKNELRNRCSDLDFNNYHAGSFSIGIEGGRLGAIVDLGTPDGLKRRYGYAETVGGGQGYASLHVEDGRIVILKNRKPQVFQELKESASLFEPGTSSANAPVRPGHIYLLRLTDRHDPAFQLFVKMIVVALNPDESVTVRWQRL